MVVKVAKAFYLTACCESQSLSTQDPTIDNSCKESDAICGNKERNLLIFTFLYMVSTVSLLNHRQTQFLIQLKTQALLRFPAVCCFSRRKYQPTKTVLLQQR